MASLRLVLMWLVVLILLLASSETFGGRLPKILKKREAAAAAAAAPGAAAAASSSVLIPHSEAKEFLSKLRRTKRNLWDRSRPDVQQWIMQFMYLGYDEQRLEADLSYWMDQSRSRDQGRQHHYDENAPIGPRDPSAYRHGANVNYDYY